VKILVINSGSSSIKYTLFHSLVPVHNGLVERVNNYESALSKILSSIGSIDAIGHRVVHGGEIYKESILIDESVIEDIENLIPIAPLHNPANLAGINAVVSLYPTLKQVAVFDTSFHQTIPDYAYMYALPYHLYTENKIRRYGFHGISHYYMLHAASSYFKKSPTDLNLISFHLGNGDSVCAIQNGISIDTSMGFTPLEGLIMGTRSGDLDPEILIYLHTQKGMSIDEIERLLNKESGLKGICGASDMRDVVQLAKTGDEKAKLAIEMFAYHAKKYLGSYIAVLGRIDAIIFTGGIGEHSALIREKIFQNLEHLGLAIDPEKNKLEHTDPFAINVDNSPIKVLVIHTNEEAIIAQETQKIIIGSDGYK
jgi:acetate kinase